MVDNSVISINRKLVITYLYYIIATDRQLMQVQHCMTGNMYFEYILIEHGSTHQVRCYCIYS